ncbi:hypothetical protein [Bacteroides gallinaceum]|uniref:hypothetical protein n=1 Tax=Bacteroides gallinaceum TaxID=1462571 RepID=UPI00195968DE|nr:hypothetical protein [Bacteroides gallinaceum]MBM6660020.1 hypothetical protein [Bacteroides gallinaceum]
MTLIPGFHRLPPPFPLRSKDGGRRWRSCTSNLTVGQEKKHPKTRRLPELVRNIRMKPEHTHADGTPMTQKGPRRHKLYQ